MFCPECRSEYREGITTCADCDLPLVPELEPEEGPAFTDEVLAPLHYTYDFNLVGALTERLEKAGIAYVINAGTGLALFDGSSDGENFEPEGWEARILVYGPMLLRARRILEQLKLGLTSE